MQKFTLALLMFSFSLIAQGQTAIHEFSKAYFRSDPFSSTARFFLQHLLNDPDITAKKPNTVPTPLFSDLKAGIRSITLSFSALRKLK